MSFPPESLYKPRSTGSSRAFAMSIRTYIYGSTAPVLTVSATERRTPSRASSTIFARSLPDMVFKIPAIIKLFLTFFFIMHIIKEMHKPCNSNDALSFGAEMLLIIIPVTAFYALLFPADAFCRPALFLTVWIAGNIIGKKIQ